MPFTIFDLKTALIYNQCEDYDKQQHVKLDLLRDQKRDC